jgi:hypothetical protein
MLDPERCPPQHPSPLLASVGWQLDRYRRAQRITAATVGGALVIAAIIAILVFGLWAITLAGAGILAAITIDQHARWWAHRVHSQARNANQTSEGRAWLRHHHPRRRSPFPPTWYLEVTADARQRSAWRLSIPLQPGHAPPDQWRQGDAVTILGPLHPGRVLVVVIGDAVLLPDGLSRPRYVPASRRPA